MLAEEEACETNLDDALLGTRPRQVLLALRVTQLAQGGGRDVDG